MRLKWTLLIIGGIVLITGVLLSFNPNVRGAAKLAITGSPVVTLASKEDTKTVMTKMNAGDGFKEVLWLIETDGWLLTDQIGSTLIFSRDEESLVLMMKMWTNQYIVAEMTEG
ncbi:hypothetical protein [Sutcliffiella halmapala]|uniref:hypothetical protein n=1 Tax=Sutcliffiella halmapala TaxID=79882 RepID=UPI000994B253|nr:hypothetical protein [Sutcliffiella halmapala]